MAFGTTNISFSAVKAQLGETTNSLKALCTSPKINKWATHSPLTQNGNVINFNTTPAIQPWYTPVWNYTHSVTLTRYSLGDFRRYDHYSNKPCDGNFPTEIISGGVSLFGLSMLDTPSNPINTVIKPGTKYFGVAFRRKGEGSYVWCTNPNKGHPFVSLNIPSFYPAGTTIEACLFYADDPKNINDPDKISTFWSIRCDEYATWKKEFVVKPGYTPDAKYNDIHVEMDPLNGTWDGAGCHFTTIEIGINNASVDAYHQYSLKLSSIDNRYHNTYNMLSKKYVTKGDRVSLCIANNFRLGFFEETITTIRLEVLDILAGNKFVEEYLISNYIIT